MTSHTGREGQKMGWSSKIGSSSCQVVLDIIRPQLDHCLSLFCVYMLQSISRMQLHSALRYNKAIIYCLLGGLPSVTSPYLGFS